MALWQKGRSSIWRYDGDSSSVFFTANLFLHSISNYLSNRSVIVYVWRQRDAEVVAESIQAAGVAGGVVHYHGGMDSGTRSNAYSKVRKLNDSTEVYH